MQKDELLKKLFFTLVKHMDTPCASRFLTCGEVYYISRVCVLKCAPTREELAFEEGKLYTVDKDIPLQLIAKPEAMRPENMLGKTELALPTEAFVAGATLLPVAKMPKGVPSLWVLEESKECAEFNVKLSVPYTKEGDFTEVPLAQYVIPQAIISFAQKQGKSFETFKPSLAEANVVHVPVITLTSDTGMLYTTLALVSSSSPHLQIVRQDEDKEMLYKGDGWLDTKRHFKSLILKEIKEMKGLTTPLMEPKQVASVVPVEPKAETVTEIKNEVQLPAETQTVVAVAEAPAEARTITPVVVEETQPEEVSQATTVEDKPKRTRTVKPIKAVKLDYNSIIAEIGNGVPAVESGADAEAALEEIRLLRDLQAKACSRMANLATAMQKFSANALKTYDQLQQLLKH